MRIRHLPAALATVLIAAAPLAFAATPQTASTPAASAPASSTQQWSQHRDGRMHHPRGILDQLDLSAAQRTSIQKLRQESFQQARADMQTLRQPRMAFDDATPGGAGYQDTVDALATAEANVSHARVLRDAKLRAAIYGVLTPAQRTKAASLRAERKARMQQWREAHMQHKAATPSAAPATSSN